MVLSVISLVILINSLLIGGHGFPSIGQLNDQPSQDSKERPAAIPRESAQNASPGSGQLFSLDVAVCEFLCIYSVEFPMVRSVSHSSCLLYTRHPLEGV